MKTKRIVTLMVALMMMVSLAACGNSPAPAPEVDKPADQSAPVTKEPDAKEPEAQAWAPEKDFSIRVPFGAGGSADTFTRIIGQGLQDTYGATVIINNLTGANGTIAANDLLSQKPDASDLMAGGIAMFTLAPLFSPDIQMNLEDYKMVAGIVSEDFILATNPSESGIHTWEELEAYGKENRVLFSSNTPGGATHMLGTALFGEAGLKSEAVTSAGSNNDVLALLSGDVIATIAPASLIEQHIDGDSSLVPIAVFSEDAYTGFQGLTVPTVKDSGYDIVFRSLNFLMTRAEVAQEDVDAVYNAIEEFRMTDKFVDLAQKAKYIPDHSDGEQIRETIEKAAILSKEIFDKYYAK